MDEEKETEGEKSVVFWTSIIFPSRRHWQLLRVMLRGEEEEEREEEREERRMRGEERMGGDGDAVKASGRKSML